MSKIISYLKWIASAIIALGVLALIAYEMWGKNKQKAQVDQRIQELNAIEQKTEADKQELEQLNQQSVQIQTEIEATTQRYAEKLKDLDKPKEDKPGDAGRAADDFQKNW